LMGVTALIVVAGYFHVGWWLKSMLTNKRKDSRPPSPPSQDSKTDAAPAKRGSKGENG
jgi:hypothetical protein